MICVQCIVSGEENPKNCPLPLGFCHPAGGGPSHGHRQHAHVVPVISSQTDTQTHTDLLITILRNNKTWAVYTHGEYNITMLNI